MSLLLIGDVLLILGTLFSFLPIGLSLYRLSITLERFAETAISPDMELFRRMLRAFSSQRRTVRDLLLLTLGFIMLMASAVIQLILHI